ncbi:lecithin retinol acyltransferase-like [Betta splendens]|uniref:Lecithin retinol acyltransferase-like n=1 Tax=Betta splendens TaxID=158456 RepID=A0A6P7KVN4_BETSP|nr:lecithin retinol acyltransferase-like [Betta splendens]
MLDTLIFLLEKLFLLAHVKLSSLLPPRGRSCEDAPSSRRCDRDDAAPWLQFQRGDLLEVPRTLFTHFGIYLGEDRVAHLIPDVLPALTADSRHIREMVSNTRLLLGVLSKRASVRVDSVEDFAYGAGIVPNALDRAVVPSPLCAEEVAARAERLVGPVSYSLLWNNCEHFVTYCRYGTARSLQTEKTESTREASGATFPSLSPLQLLALLFISVQSHNPEEQRRKREEEEEDDRAGERSKYDRGFRRGDLLEVPRTLFTHFGIYLGGDRVAHFIPDIVPVVSCDQRRVRQMVTNTRLLLGVLAKCVSCVPLCSARVDSVDDFAYGSQVLINTMDAVCSRPALPSEDVARSAERLRGHGGYSLLWYNCEHYVMYCRYGAAASFQTFQFCKTVRKLVLSRRVAMVTAVLGACVLLCLRAVSIWTGPLAVLLPFVIWMAS